MVTAVGNVAELGPRDAVDGVVRTGTDGTALVLDGADIGVEVPPCASVEAGELLPATDATPPRLAGAYVRGVAPLSPGVAHVNKMLYGRGGLRTRDLRMTQVRGSAGPDGMRTVPRRTAPNLDTL